MIDDDPRVRPPGTNPAGSMPPTVRDRAAKPGQVDSTRGRATVTRGNAFRGAAANETVFLFRCSSGWYLPGPAMPAPRRGFDTDRPGWLSRPDFTPADTFQPGPANPDDAVIDFTRPELWMNDDGEFSAGAPQRHGGPRLSVITAMLRSCGRRLARRRPRATSASPAVRSWHGPNRPGSFGQNASS